MQTAEYALEEILDDATSRALYIQFLETCKLLEPLLFIEQVEEFVILKSAHNRFQRATHIVETFLLPKAPYELNLEHNSRASILAHYNQCSSEKCDPQLFESLSMTILLDLKQNTVSRFCKTKAFMEYRNMKNQDAAVSSTSIRTRNGSFNCPAEFISKNFFLHRKNSAPPLGRDNQAFRVNNELLLVPSLTAVTLPEDHNLENGKQKVITFNIIH
jgi:Regulator of G protein signaling domain